MKVDVENWPFERALGSSVEERPLDVAVATCVRAYAYALELHTFVLESFEIVALSIGAKLMNAVRGAFGSCMVTLTFEMYGMEDLVTVQNEIVFVKYQLVTYQAIA